MKNAILISFVFGLVILSGFSAKNIEYEQLTFDYFLSDIFKNDFKGISSIEFKGKTENTYSTLGDYKICLEPEAKLQAMFKDIAIGPAKNVTDIRHNRVKDVKISGFNNSSTAPKLFIYPALHVADHYYVFLSIHESNETVSIYVFQLNADGKNIRSCKME